MQVITGTLDEILKQLDEIIGPAGPRGTWDETFASAESRGQSRNKTLHLIFNDSLVNHGIRHMLNVMIDGTEWGKITHEEANRHAVFAFCNGLYALLADISNEEPDQAPNLLVAVRRMLVDREEPKAVYLDMFKSKAEEEGGKEE